MVIPLIVVFLWFAQVPNSSGSEVEGAWDYHRRDDWHSIFVFSDGFWCATLFNGTTKEFTMTSGGRYEITGDQMVQFIEFDSGDSSEVGTRKAYGWRFEGDELVISNAWHGTPFRRIDNGTPGKLSGAWVITGRMTDGELRTMTPGARRTMKILSGTRFQWIAYNVETKEFSGTGGGTYTTIDGKYTENIEFFSRDNSRVGASLSFDFALEGKTWRHKGLSSKGEPIDEVWSRRIDIGL